MLFCFCCFCSFGPLAGIPGPLPAVSLGHPDDSGGKSKNEAASAEMWLNLGGSGIDTAARYHNQDQVAIAIEACGFAKIVAVSNFETSVPSEWRVKGTSAHTLHLA